jgi:hypothetical protein
MTAKTETIIKLPDHSLIFNTPNDFLIKRALDVLESEPETIAWIDLMTESDILWDKGANVGTYSIYASIIKKLKIVAFEPEASNY